MPEFLELLFPIDSYDNGGGCRNFAVDRLNIHIFIIMGKTRIAATPGAIRSPQLPCNGVQI